MSIKNFAGLLAAGAVLVSTTGCGLMPRNPKEFNINLGDTLGTVILSKTFSSENNESERKLTEYRAISRIDEIMGTLPVAGDVINFTWTFTPTENIKTLYARIVENTEAVNWWKELEENIAPESCILKTDLKANQAVTISFTRKIAAKATAGAHLYVFSNLDDVSAEPVLAQAVDLTKPGFKHVAYYSSVCERNRYMTISLPDNYSPEKEYPVMFFLSGFFENEWSWVDTVKDQTKKEMIVVHPFVYCSKTRTNATGFGSIEDSLAYDKITEEIPEVILPWLKKNFPNIKAGRDNTAVIGFSMGGRESLACGLLRPDVFGYVGAICPAPGMLASHIGGVPEVPEEKNAFQNAEKPKYLMIYAGGNDNVVGSSPKDYADHFKNSGIDHYFHTVSGSGHGNPAIAEGVAKFTSEIF